MRRNPIVKRNRMLYRTVALAAAVVLTANGLTASVSAEETRMTFRLEASRSYLFASEVKETDVVLQGAMYIEHYSGINMMRLTLGSDPEIVIENGGFSVPNFLDDPYDYDPELTSNSYNDYSSVQDVHNLVAWYGPGMINTNGIIDDPDASFLTFDVRVPQNIPVGQYQLYFDQRVLKQSSGKDFPLLSVYAEEGEYGNDLPAIDLQSFTFTVEPDPVRGNVNGDGRVDVADAMCVLRYYAAGLVGKAEKERMELLHKEYPHMGYAAGNVDNNTICDLNDATFILRYYVATLIGDELNWDQIINDKS